METLRNYLETMFHGYPNTPDIIKAKEELYAMMEDKYHELIGGGMSENAAIGQVITEFGNLQELSDVLNITDRVSDGKEDLPIISLDQAKKVFEDYEKGYPIIARGIHLILLGVVFLMTLIYFSEIPEFNPSEDPTVAFGLVGLLSFVAIGVYFIINANRYLTPHEHLEKETFVLDYSAKQWVSLKHEEHRVVSTNATSLSVILFILSPLPVISGALTESYWIVIIASFVLLVFTAILKRYEWLVLYIPLSALFIGLSVTYGFNTLFGVNYTLLMVALGVYNLVKEQGISQASEILLQLGEFSTNKKSDLVQTVSTIYWTIVVAAYLAWSFLTNNWHITWLIWPIAGVLYSGLEAWLKYRERHK